MNESEKESAVQKAASLIHSLLLKDYSITGLEAYLRYIAYPFEETLPVAFSYKIHDNSREFADSINMLKTFENACNLIVSDFVLRSIDEKRLLKNPNLIDKVDGNGIVIYSSSEEPLSSSEKEAWNHVIQKLEVRPELVRFLCASDQVFRTRFRENEHLYYRVFRYDVVFRIFLQEDVKPLLYHQLEDVQIIPNKEFDEGITKYIEEVYSKADLKGPAFVKDLTERIAELQAKLRPEHVANLSCVPFYNKSDSDTSDERLSDQPEGTKKESEEVKVASIKPFHAPKGTLQKDSAKKILILSLSTFPYNGTMIKTSYTYLKDKKKDDIVGAYQLEVVPKLLACKNIFFDEVIILSTDSTRRPKKEIFIEDRNGEKERIRWECLSSDPESDGVSELDYFTSFYDSICEKQNIHPYYKDVHISDPGDAKNKNDYDSQKDIQNTIVSINQILEEIRNQRDADIYVDIHGGSRVTQQLITGILYLLKNEGRSIKPDHIFTADRGWVSSAGVTFSIYDFISGINELMYYGRTESLNNYKNKSHTTEAENDLVNELKTIAESIQLNNIKGFEDALNQLPNKIRNCQSASKKNSFLSLYLNNIENHYQTITKEGRTVLDEIRWSLDHGFYQQVLTLIESRMPDYFKEKGWLDFSESAMRIASEKTDDRIRQYRAVFNAVIPTLIPKKDRLKPLIQSKDPRYNPLSKGILESSILNRRVIRTVTHTYSGYTVQVDQPLKAIICLHIAFKELRNLCNHTDTENFPDISMKLLVQQVNNYLNWILKLKGQPEIRVN